MRTERTTHESVTAEIAETTGKWITPPVNYVDPVREFCALCGRPIARKYWAVGEGEKEARYCTAEHAALRTTYPVEPE